MNAQLVKRLPAVVLAGALAGSLAACTPYTALLTIAPVGPEDSRACGPATAEMVMRNYPSPPSPAGGCPLVAAPPPGISVQTLFREAPVPPDVVPDPGWDTGPTWMRAALTTLCPPPGGSWHVFAESDYETLMYSVAHYLATNHYPVALVLETTAHVPSDPLHQEHWVTVTGIQTDVDPTTNAHFEVEYVWFNDPNELGMPAMTREATGAAWRDLLFQQVTKPGSYFGKLVAVVEPPAQPGSATSRREVLSGKVISERLAVRKATKWVRRRHLGRQDSYRAFAQSRPLPPILVNAEHGGYYLVPYSPEGGKAGLAVLVNAYTGGFQEVGAFASSDFLSAVEAEKLALAATQTVNPQSLRTEAISSSSAGASRYRPLWRVWIDGRAIDVTQDRKVRPADLREEPIPDRPRAPQSPRRPLSERR